MIRVKEAENIVAKERTRMAGSKLILGRDVYCRDCNKKFNIALETAAGYIEASGRYHPKENCDLLEAD